MAQSKTYLDADGNEIKGTGAYLDETGKISGPVGAGTKSDNPTSIAANASGIFSPDPEAVTLADLIADPKAAVKKMIATTTHGFSNPRVAIPMAIGAGLGIARLAGVGTGAMPVPEGEAPAPVAKVGIGQAIRENVSHDDVVGMLPKTVRSAYNVARGVARAAQQVGKPIETPGGPVTVPEAPAQAAAEPAVAVKPPVEASPLEKFEITDAEAKDAVKWHQQGVSPEVIRDRILHARLFTSLKGTPTPAEAAAKVQSALHTGKF